MEIVEVEFDRFACRFPERLEYYIFWAENRLFSEEEMLEEARREGDPHCGFREEIIADLRAEVARLRAMLPPGAVCDWD